MSIVITGTTGFLGEKLLARSLAQGHHCLGLDMCEGSEHCVTGDITDPAVADLIPEGAEAVVHLAAMSRDPDCRDRAYECFKVNVMGTLNLMRAARARKVKQFVFASTEWVYDAFTNDAIKAEDSSIDLANHDSEYALSKLVSEQNIRQQYSRGFMDAMILRFGIIYGPRPDNWSAVEGLASKVKKGETVTVGSLATGRHFIHVDDVIAGIVRSLGVSGLHTVNIQGDHLVTLGEVIETAGRIYGREPDVSESNPDNPSIRRVSTIKQSEVLGFTPQIDLEAGIRSCDQYL